MTDSHNSAVIDADALKTFMTTVFERLGVPGQQAADAADVLVWASLCGIDTHGVRNLKDHYVDDLADGRINCEPRFRIEHETPVSARTDGDNGLGLVAACWAMRYAINKAAESGICLVTMHNSHHFGAAGYYPLMAVAHDMIGISMTGFLFTWENQYGVPPTFGAQPLLSTNPLSFAFPTHTEPPFLLDMATSVVAFNRILMMNQLGKSIPLGWGLDSDGRPTTDPAAARQVLPLGGTRELGSHKGYGLALVVEVLCAVLSGGWFDSFTDGLAGEKGQFAYGRFANRPYTQKRGAHFLGAIRVDAFREADDFKKGLDAMIQTIHASRPAPGHDRIYVPGEIEHETAQKRRREGIPLPDYVLSELRELSAKYEVPLTLI
jgi:LDH2 family malate/lactate/ureidoglycolate dehydrogenase